MAHRSRLALPRQVWMVRNEIGHWRRTKTGRTTPMPEDLWKAATELARAHGVYPIAKALGVSYEPLKRRAAVQVQARKSGVAAAATFVELWPGQQVLSTGPVGDSVEITNNAGDKLAAQLAAGHRLDIVALVAAFVGRAG
jgi:hypothetical protein